MKILKDIDINNDKLSPGLMAAIGIIRDLEKDADGESVVDFSRTKFINPLFVVSLAVFSNGRPLRYSMENVTSYMKNIHMDSWGVDAEQMGRDFSAFMKDYEDRSYIPLVCFPGTENKLDIKDAILTTVISIIATQSDLRPNIIPGLNYMLGEITDNISEHSKSAKGFIFAQCYPQRGFMDICVGDIGVTLLGSFKNIGRFYIDTDMEAMRAAQSGVSTKNLPGAENRGYGVRTSDNMLVSGLKGQYVMISGTTIFYSIPTKHDYMDLPFGAYMPGTVVALRIPLTGNEEFYYLNYVE